jgi:hypothetical protein
MDRARFVSVVTTLALGITQFLYVSSTVRGDFVIGDIAIVGYRADADDALAFVSWVDLPASTSLYFTDSGFFADGTLRDTESILSWSSPDLLQAGSVVVITSSAGSSTANVGQTIGSLDSLAVGGDQIFVSRSPFPALNRTTAPGTSYEQSDLLFGFDFNGAAGWDADASNSSSSALPASLSLFQANLTVPHFDNGQYTGPRFGLAFSDYRQAVLDVSQWTFNDNGTSFGGLNNTSFTAVPEPSSLFSTTLLAVMLVCRRPTRRPCPFRT